MRTTRTALLLAAAFCGYSVFASDPAISDVTVRQRWPWSKLVDIDYVLTCDATKTVDIAVSGFNDVNELALPGSSLSGDLYNVSYGARRIVWDPTATAYTNAGVLGKFSVALAPMSVPLYIIVDLTKDAEAEGQIEYVYESDLRTNKWGSWVENPVTNRGTNIQSVIWTGVTNDPVYATDKLVLRRVPASTFKMGTAVPPTVSTILTKPFYTGVFEVTQRQWELITEETPSYFTNATYYARRPVESRSYEDIRGASNNVPTVNWPVTDRTVVAPGSFLAKLRAKTGLDGLDLPTEAQWEYACRAGTTTVFNDGLAGTPNATSNAQINVLGRYAYNGGKVYGELALEDPPKWCAADNGTATVGSYFPNAWGLYDMHGNVWEWCLDWFDSSWILSGGLDPKGADSGSQRLRRGGAWNSGSSSCALSYRTSNRAPATKESVTAFRLVMNLP